MAAKKKSARNARHKKRFEMLHPGMTRSEWAKFKRDEKRAKKALIK